MKLGFSKLLFIISTVFLIVVVYTIINTNLTMVLVMIYITFHSYLNITKLVNSGYHKKDVLSEYRKLIAIVSIITSSIFIILNLFISTNSNILIEFSSHNINVVVTGLLLGLFSFGLMNFFLYVSVKFIPLAADKSSLGQVKLLLVAFCLGAISCTWNITTHYKNLFIPNIGSNAHLAQIAILTVFSITAFVVSVIATKKERDL